MWEDKDEYILRCDCGEIRHSVYLWFHNDKGAWGKSKDNKYTELFISLNVENVSLWERIKNAFFYIFKQRKFWHYGDIWLNLRDSKQIKQLDELISWLDDISCEAKNEL